MQNQQCESMFNRIYLWMTVAKMTMGIFFVLYVFTYLLLGLISEGMDVLLDFWTAFQMMLAAFFVGIMQQILLSGRDNFTKLRISIWILSGTAITLGFTAIFHWFDEFPLWCSVLFIGFTAVAMVMMVWNIHLQFRRETRLLNKQLELFQKNKSFDSKGL